MNRYNLNRKKFIQGMGAVLTLSALQRSRLAFADTPKNLRVGLIGAGWYGKSDLFRLIQGRDVNVVAVCDVDERHLKEAGHLLSGRQASGKVPQRYEDYRKMLVYHRSS